MERERGRLKYGEREGRLKYGEREREIEEWRERGRLKYGEREREKYGDLWKYGEREGGEIERWRGRERRRL